MLFELLSFIVNIGPLGGDEVPTRSVSIYLQGFPKLVVPNKPMGFPTKNDQHLGWRLGYHHLRKPPYKVKPTAL